MVVVVIIIITTAMPDNAADSGSNSSQPGFLLRPRPSVTLHRYSIITHQSLAALVDKDEGDGEYEQGSAPGLIEDQAPQSPAGNSPLVPLEPEKKYHCYRSSASFI